MHPYGVLSLLPVLVAVGLALWQRQVVLALLAGAFTAALVLHGGDPIDAGVALVDPLLLDALSDRDHMKVTLFSLLVAATIQLASASGGTRAMVERIAGRASTRRGGMLATWGAGMVVFFDDYANCLVVGSAMRPLADRLRISREKLAYLVDSTAAPMATVALVSTWIGYEVGLVDDALKASGQSVDAYAFFMQGLPYRFYPLLALAFAGLIAWSGRDFGPMAAAERAARAAPSPAPAPAQTAVQGHALFAVLPIATLVLVTGGSLWRQGVAAVGSSADLFQIIGGADGYDAMLHGSLASVTTAAALALRPLGPSGVSSAILDGMRELFEPLVVLFLAWALSAGIGQLDAAGYLVGLLGDGLPGPMLPTAVFVVSAAVAFATGTSFGTMGVMMPLVIPLAFATDPAIAVATSAAVLSGATWGDHCSPISDTTVLSSTGAGCDHSAHVRTQLPYALAAGALSILVGTLPAGYGAPAWASLLLGIAGCVAVIYGVGRPLPPLPQADEQASL